MDGEGLLYYPDGSFVHGFFYKSKLNGPGFLKLSSGEIYEGNNFLFKLCFV